MFFWSLLKIKILINKTSVLLLVCSSGVLSRSGDSSESAWHLGYDRWGRNGLEGYRYQCSGSRCQKFKQWVIPPDHLETTLCWSILQTGRSYIIKFTVFNRELRIKVMVVMQNPLRLATQPPEPVRSAFVHTL